MDNKLDMALDDLVKTERTNRRGRGRGRGRARGRMNPIQRPQPQPDVGSKILISNLHFGVTESDLRELFSTMGPLKRVSLAFDANGKSKGTAEVEFVRKQDAISSMKKYNNVQLDGRPMKMEMTTKAVPVAQRVQQQQPKGRGRGRGRGRGGKPKTAEELDAEMNNYMQQQQDVAMNEAAS